MTEDHATEDHMTEDHATEDYATTTSPAWGDALFEDLDMQLLWDCAVVADPVYCILHLMVTREDGSLPSGINRAIQMPDCSFDVRGVLGDRDIVWLPNYEPLRTSLI